MPNIVHCLEIFIARIKGFFHKGEVWIALPPVVYNEDSDEWEPLWATRGHTHYQHRSVGRVLKTNGVVYDVYGYKFYEDKTDLEHGDGVVSGASVRRVTNFPYVPHTILVPYGGWRHRVLEVQAAWRDFWNLY